MKVIGAGYGRTGTVSLKEALEHLGYPCYHMQEVMQAYGRGHVDVWDQALTGHTDIDWTGLFAGYEATVDFPACVFYRELMDAFPDAVVILSVRDPERWWNSFSKLLSLVSKAQYFGFVPMFRKFSAMNVHLVEYVFDGLPDKDRAIGCYLRHIEDVKEKTPAERLLVYRISEGWEPLCQFLDKPVPNIPFPHANAGITELRRKIAEQFWKHGPGRFFRKS
ncbi:MAG: sulfotransferase [Gammaproteobacteria bacterium]|jgi:hypothetical protein|nr:sulfotransferase family protein [Chromatiales bacterium]MDP6673526.1 sulfotransferase [Gammaproteobacteria bacterium]